MPLRAPGGGFEHEVLIVPRVAAMDSSGQKRLQELVWSTGRRPHHDVFTDRSVGFCALLFFLVVLNGMDAATTMYGTMKLGWQVEANPVLRWIGANLTHAGFLVYKALVVVVVVTSLWWMHRGFSRAAAAARVARWRRVYVFWRFAVEAAALGLVLLFALIVVNNLVVVARSL